MQHIQLPKTILKNKITTIQKTSPWCVRCIRAAREPVGVKGLVWPGSGVWQTLYHPSATQLEAILGQAEHPLLFPLS